MHLELTHTWSWSSAIGLKGVGGHFWGNGCSNKGICGWDG